MWLCVALHILTAGAFVILGALSCRFILITPFWVGGLLGFSIYTLVLVFAWLIERSGAEV